VREESGITLVVVVKMAGRERLGESSEAMEINALYEKYSPWVFQRCLRFTRSREDAEDLMHNIFLKLIKNLKTFRKEASPYTWIYKITTNLCLNYLRDRKETLPFNEEAATVLSDNGKSQFSSESNLYWKEMLSGFNTLTKRIAFLLVLEALSQEEVAKILGLSRKTVQKKWSHFKEKIQLRLKRGVLS